MRIPRRPHPTEVSTTPLPGGAGVVVVAHSEDEGEIKTLYLHSGSAALGDDRYFKEIHRLWQLLTTHGHSVSPQRTQSGSGEDASGVGERQ